MIAHFSKKQEITLLMITIVINLSCLYIDLDKSPLTRDWVIILLLEIAFQRILQLLNHK